MPSGEEVGVLADRPHRDPPWASFSADPERVTLAETVIVAGQLLAVVVRVQSR